MDYICQNCGHTWNEDDWAGKTCPICGTSSIRINEDE